ncbi:hypothetical protein AX15_003514 [Amanita polypyramis BW_CC]|nr:hypothetical protein AX15_003514 [Amanita polypyramis BW_CC]
MLLRAPFPSFTTVILSASDFYSYSDHYSPTKLEKELQSHFRRELDFMKTIDLRHNDYQDSAFFNPYYITDDGESSGENEYLHEKKKRRGFSGEVFKPKYLVPRFVNGLMRLCNRRRYTTQKHAREVELDLNN